MQRTLPALPRAGVRQRKGATPRVVEQKATKQTKRIVSLLPSFPSVPCFYAAFARPSRRSPFRLAGPARRGGLPRGAGAAVGLCAAGGRLCRHERPAGGPARGLGGGFSALDHSG